MNDSTDNKEKDPIVFTSFFETPEYILEQINFATHATHATSEMGSQFLIYEKGSRLTEVRSSFTYGNTVFHPITDDLTRRGSILLPSKLEEYGSTDQLIEEIRQFLYQYFEVPGFYKTFLPYLILFYWVYEKFPFIPYVHFMGRTGTGKSTAMEVLGSICYKPIDASGSITLSSIFRIADLWHGTLLLDEFNAGGENYAEMLSLLKSGVSNKLVLRVEGDRKREVKGYIVKSPKIFTSERPISDAGLRSRVLEIKMEKNKNRVPLYRQNTFEVKAQELRNKLLLWRLHTFSGIDLSVIEYGFDELAHFDGRVQQVITPIYYMASESAKKEILEFAKEQQEETLRERRESLDGQIFNVIYENQTSGAFSSLKDITEKINKGAHVPLTERKVAGIVKKILRFDIQRLGHEKISTVILQDEVFTEHCTYYGLESLPILRVASDASVATPEDAEDIFGSN